MKTKIFFRRLSTQLPKIQLSLLLIFAFILTSCSAVKTNSNTTAASTSKKQTDTTALSTTSTNSATLTQNAPLTKTGIVMANQESIDQKSAAGERYAQLDENPGVDEPKYSANVQPTNNNNSELLTVKLRYKEPSETTSKLLQIGLTDKQALFETASDNLRFAAAVAEFGLLLRDSRYKGNANFDNLLLQIAQNARGNDLRGYRTEFAALVGKAKNLAARQARLN